MALWPYGRVPGLLLGVALSLHTELCRASVGRASRSLGWILFFFEKLETFSKPNQKLPGNRHILSNFPTASLAAGIESSKPILKEGHTPCPQTASVKDLFAVSERLGCGVSAQWTN